MKKFLFLSIAVAIIGGAGFLYYTNYQKPVTNLANNSSTNNSTNTLTGDPSLNIIHITADGFSPIELGVQENTAVTFVNDNISSHWPASDPHPSHTINPAFDPKKAIPPGESWTFTFNKAGIWRFHDHLNPIQRSTIIVSEKSTINTPASPVNTSSNKFSDKCIEASHDFFCYENYYSKLVKENGIATAFTDLKVRYEKNSYVRSQCHPITHVIGHMAVELYPVVSQAYTHGDSFCWSGFYHGVMEGIIGKVGRAKIASQLNNICTDIPGKENYSFDYYNCVHGLGHGLMVLTENELFDSLKLCDNVQGSWEQTSCYGGVFMENVIVDNKNHFTKYLKPKDLLYPCNAVNEIYKSSCYLMQTSYMLKIVNDFGKVFELCRKADIGFSEICFQSLGRDVSGRSLSNAETTKKNCELGSNYTERSNCIIGAVKDFISYYHSDQQGYALCKIIAADLKQICTDTAVSYYKSF